MNVKKRTALPRVPARKEEAVAINQEQYISDTTSRQGSSSPVPLKAEIKSPGILLYRALLTGLWRMAGWEMVPAALVILLLEGGAHV